MDCNKCQSCKHEYTEEKNKNSPLPRITSLFLGLTEDCTMKCIYCFVHQNPSKMSFKTALDGVMWVSRQTTGNFTINLFGGEPMMRWDDIIVPLVTVARSMFGNRVSFNMTTNGVALFGDKLKFAKDNNMSVLLSFDGCKECQDHNRPLKNSNKSSFDVVAKNIPAILEAFPTTTMRMTVDQSTVKYFYQNHLYAYESGFKSSFSCVNAFGEWSDDSIATLYAEQYKVADLFIEIVKRGEWFEFNPLMRGFDKIRMERESTSRSFPATIGHGKCGIGANQAVVIGTDEKFYTCQETYTNEKTRDFYNVGDLRNGIDDMKRIDVLKNYVPELVESSGINCSSCKIKNTCDGGCLVRNRDVTGDFNIVPAIYCIYENIMVDVCLYIYEELKDNDNFKNHIKFRG